MEEVYAERRAAFSATFSRKIVPLMFEVASDLGAADVPRIDTLLDSADLFLGIYDTTLGNQKVPSYPHLTPLEYELYRFVFTVYWSDRRFTGTDLRERVASSLRSDSSHLEEIKLPGGGFFREIFGNRVWLYMKYHGQCDKRLARFLKPYDVTWIKPEEIESKRQGESSHWNPITSVLQSRLCRDIDVGFRSKQFKRATNNRRGLIFDFMLLDEPGSLEAALDAVASLGFNVLHVQHKPSAKTHSLKLWCLPVRPFSRTSAADRQLQAAGVLGDVRQICSETVDIATHDNIFGGDKDWSNPERKREGYSLVARTLRAPGILALIAKRLARRDINVSSVSHNGFRDSQFSEEQEFEFHFLYSAKDRNDTLRGICHEVPNIIGVVHATIVEQSKRSDSHGDAQRQRSFER